MRWMTAGLANSSQERRLASTTWATRAPLLARCDSGCSVMWLFIELLVGFVGWGWLAYRALSCRSNVNGSINREIGSSSLAIFGRPPHSNARRSTAIHIAVNGREGYPWHVPGDCGVVELHRNGLEAAAKLIENRKNSRRLSKSRNHLG